MFEKFVDMQFQKNTIQAIEFSSDANVGNVVQRALELFQTFMKKEFNREVKKA